MSAAAVFFANASILDAHAGALVPARSVLVRDGAIGDRTLTAPDGARTIDLCGMTLMPAVGRNRGRSDRACFPRTAAVRSEECLRTSRHGPNMQFVRRSKRIVYANPWIRFEAYDIVHPNGQPGEHGLVVAPPASAVVVYDEGMVWFTRQARFAVDEVVLEIVKGGAEPGESALAAAQRETREEIGVEAARWDSLGLTYELPSIIDHSVALFFARELSHVPTEHERVESIETVRMPFEAALEAALNGELRDAVTGLALLRAARVLERERAHASVGG